MAPEHRIKAVTSAVFVVQHPAISAGNPAEAESVA